MVVRLLASTGVRGEKLVFGYGIWNGGNRPRPRSEIIVEVQQSFLAKRGEVTRPYKKQSGNRDTYRASATDRIRKPSAAFRL